MKTIGLLGGTSWVSTIDYYQNINRQVNEKLGAQHSAKIIINSIDYQEIKQYNYQDWGKITDILKREVIKLANCGVDCIIIGCATLHKIFNEIESLNLDIPVFHIADAVGEHAQRQNYKKLLMLGTKFTMEDNYFSGRLIDKFGLEITIPRSEDRIEIHRIIQEEISKENISDKSKEWFHDMIKRYPSDGIVLGCTELPRIAEQKNIDVPILNIISLHCDKAVDFVLGGE